MVRQLSKELGGIEAAVCCVDDAAARELFERHARREMKRSGDGVFVDATVDGGRCGRGCWRSASSG